MTRYITLEDALLIAERATGVPVEVRDFGLLESALNRPATEVFGADAYGSLPEKSAALLQSLVGNHALVDGNKRLGFAGTAVFLGINGHPLSLTEDEAYELTMDVAKGVLNSVPAIARRLAGEPSGRTEP